MAFPTRVVRNTVTWPVELLVDAGHAAWNSEGKSAVRITNASYDFIKLCGGVIGAPGGTRTPDTQVRSLVLYPAELRARRRRDSVRCR